MTEGPEEIDRAKVKRLAMDVSERFESEHFTIGEVSAALLCLATLAAAQAEEELTLSHGPGCTCFENDGEIQ